MTITNHGHHIEGTSYHDEAGKIPLKARCGGPGICNACSLQAATVMGQVIEMDVESEYPEEFFEDLSGYDENPNRFLERAKLFVVGAHAVETAETEETELTVEDLYIVWWSYVLGSWKAMISTTIPGDGLYFEVTHNSAKQETYVDTYKKTANNVFSHHDF